MRLCLCACFFVVILANLHLVNQNVLRVIACPGTKREVATLETQTSASHIHVGLSPTGCGWVVFDVMWWYDEVCCGLVGRGTTWYGVVCVVGFVCVTDG